MNDPNGYITEQVGNFLTSCQVKGGTFTTLHLSMFSLKVLLLVEFIYIAYLSVPNHFLASMSV